MLQDIEQRDWILHAPKAIEALIDHDVPLDALIRHDQVPIITELARRYPALRIVIDHAGKPPFSQAAMHDWQKDMTALAAHPQVVCKLSGLLTELPSPDHLELVSPALTFLSAVFGPERLIWGSDWPVLTEAGSFDQWWEITLHFLAEFPAKTRKKILRTNAEAFYVSPPKRVTKPKKAPAKEQLTITKQDHPMDKRLILLHPDDNVLVLSCDLPAKTALTVDGAVITLPHNIAIAHKMARRDIAAGDKIIKYGVPIGSSVAAIARGEHVHSHNVHSDYLPSHDRRTPAT